MVYFTCDVCGLSVKKNQIAKHCQGSCRSAWYFTCMDCNKVFEGFEYDKHTSCVSETERYAGKFLADKAKQKNDAAAKEVIKSDPSTEEEGKATEKDEDEIGSTKYLINGCEWMGWKRTIRHILQDQKEGTMKVESLWRIIRNVYTKSTTFKGEDTEMVKARFTEKTRRPRFELVMSDKFIKLKLKH